MGSQGGATAVASNIEGLRRGDTGVSRRPEGYGSLLHGYYVVAELNRTLPTSSRYTCFLAARLHVTGKNPRVREMVHAMRGLDDA